MAKTRNILLRISLDITLGLLAYTPWIVLKTAVTPFKRGFFCDDQSLMHPYHDSTITSAVMITLSLAITIICVVCVEMFRYRYGCDNLGRKLVAKQGSNIEIHPSLIYIYWTIVIFLFGAAANESLTNIAKYTVGRLRPHFFDVCKPDRSLFNCTDQYGYLRYVTEDVCTATDSHKTEEMRLSFPSGHASLTVYAAVFIMMYLQGRMTRRHCDLVRYLLQTIVFMMSFYTCLSRISDYKHHWSDVLFGAALGAMVAYLMCRFGGEYFKSTSSVCTQVERTRTDGDVTIVSTDALLTSSPSGLHRPQPPSYNSMQLEQQTPVKPTSSSAAVAGSV